MTVLSPLIEALLNPGAWPERPAEVELRQTHISYLFFTPEHVFKVKKPVDFGFLDFTTLEKRRHFCHEEVRLNRRLAEGVYLGVVAIREEGGRIRAGGPGRTVEYAVKMRRLPEERMLDDMIRREAVEEGVMERVALRISRFHKRALRDGKISRYGLPEAIEKNVEENFSQTAGFSEELLPRVLFKKIKTWSERFLRENKRLFEERVKRGFIRDCHGDIHSEHVCIENSIEIIDCIEFNERFRFSDTVSDMAFLAMDLDYLNRADQSKVFSEAYFKDFGDGRKLLDFYKCYRAYVRGKVAGLKFLEPEVTDEEKTEALIDARRHFHLAGLYATGGHLPHLIIMCGLSGTGKSAIARALAERSMAVRLSSDAVRKSLAGIRPEEKRFEPFGAGIYSEEFTERTYRSLSSRAAELLRAGRSVVLDATFSKNRFLRGAISEAKKAGLYDTFIHIIETTAPEEVIMERLSMRLKGKGAADMRPEIFPLQKASYEKKNLGHLVLDTTKPRGENLLKVVREVFGWPVQRG